MPKSVFSLVLEESIMDKNYKPMEIYIKQADILQQFTLKAKMLIKVIFIYRENILMY